MNEAAALWTTCCDALQTQVSEAAWQAWFSGLECGAVDGGTLVLSAPNVFVRDRIDERYRGLIEGVLGDRRSEVGTIRIEVRPPRERNDEIDLSTPSAPAVDSMVDGAGGDGAVSPVPGETAQTERSQTAADGDAERLVLNPRYTFEAFVTGTTNRFAAAAAMRVAEQPAVSYNPLFIHGDSGLGKTHLLHAVAHYVHENFPQYRVRCVSTETFLNEFVDSIRTNGQRSFKSRYRDNDVLIVDDIQFLEGKEGLQEEFFHTFNALYERGRQIVLSSDRHPRNMPTLEDRLRTRFGWGLITDVQAPDLETRLAILRKKADNDRVPIPNDVLELIATHVRDNIRELEGALTRITAFASLNAEPLTVPVARTVLADTLAAGRPQPITPKLILAATSDMFDLTVDDICGASRRRPLVNARQICMYVFRELTDFSYPAIGREFGGRDHTTVMHAVDKVTRLMGERRQTYDSVTDLIHRIKGTTA